MRRSDGPFPIYEIIPGQLYQRGKLHGLKDDVKEAGLKHYGITQSVALAPTYPDQWMMDNVPYEHHPIPDGLFKEVEYVTSMARDLAFYIDRGGVVLTMCNAGRNRSGLLSALIICELTGLSGSVAMDIVRKERPNALANPHFERFLESIE